MRTLPLIALAALLTTPFAAQARFGKGGSPSHHASDSSSSNDSDSHDDAPREQVHHARPAYSPPSSGYSGYRPAHRPEYRPGYYAGSGYHRYGGWHPGWYAWGFGYSPFWFSDTSGPASQYMETSASPPVVSTLEFHGQAILNSPSTPGGAGAGMMFTVEGPQLGLIADTNSLALSADDGSNAVDALHLADVHLTYALISTPYGRLRLEGGLDMAFAQDIAFFAPGGGVSGVMGFLPNVSLEAAVRVAAAPFTKVDWNVGLAYSTGMVGWRFGWRQTFLDDQGRVDGVSHQDNLYGPYLGVALAL